MAISKTQKKILDDMKAGSALIRAFDVYGGYWWFLRPTQKKVKKATVEALERAGAIRAGDNKRIFSGYQEMPYLLVTK